MSLTRFTALQRFTPLRGKPKPKAERVSPEVHAEVIARELRIAGGCIAPYLDRHAGDCRDQWGAPVRPDAVAALTLDHIREEPGGMRRSDARWMVAMCWQHHLANGWATSHRPEIRRYLATEAQR